MNRKTSLLGWAFVLLIALSVGRTWLPANPTSPETAQQTSAAVRPPADALARFPVEEQAAIRDAIGLIGRGGRFAYAKDGSEFSNREGRLPRQAAGYYREYTVTTPGSPDRGPRRLVTGSDGETYYTNDHYRTFLRLN